MKYDIDLSKVFIIAELSANHNQDIELAKKTIKAAKEAGANAIKLQTLKPEWMTLNSNKKEFLANPNGPWRGTKLFDLYKKAYLPLDWHKELFSYARSLDIEIFSSPFSTEAVDFLEEFDPVAYKIASFEITDYELIRYAAKKQKTMIISTGIASIDEVQDVVDICKKEGNEKIILLKCTSSYPAPLKEANLLTIPNMKETFGVEVGFSDHTIGISAPIVAVSLGARVVEKHFILDKSIPSLDRDFSLDKNEFALMVKSIREAEELLGKVDYSLNEKKLNSRKSARSLYAIKDIKKGEVFTKKNIKAIRPGYGLHPKYLPKILGKKARKDIDFATAISWDMVE